MDHKWGRNVTEKWLGDLGATLAARSLVHTPGTWITNAKLGHKLWRVVFIPTDTSLPMQLHALNSTDAQPHFPFWVNVEPDGPV